MSLHERFYTILSRLLGLDPAQDVAGMKFSFGAAWASRGALWLLFGCLGLAAAAAVFYLRYQPTRRRRVRLVLLTARAAVLCVVLLLLAEPILTLSTTSRKRPALWLLFDGTESMAIADDLPADERAATARAVGIAEDSAQASDAAGQRPSRMDYVRALVQKKDDNLLARFAKEFRLQAFLFDSPKGVRSIELGGDGKTTIDAPRVAGQLTTGGKVTALGSALVDLGRRQATANVGGLVVFSDFNQNAGPPAVEAARRLGVPIYAVGMGATRAVDAWAEVSAEPFAHKDEKTAITVVVQQTGLKGQSVRVRLMAEPLASLDAKAAQRTLIGQQDVELAGRTQSAKFSYVPKDAGRFNLVAEVEPLPGEAIAENNRAGREITVLDDCLRLMFIEYEPTWDWRFIKEVFHRDRLVGPKGFRTYLDSSDLDVRKQGKLFLTTMTPLRSEFFAHDLIFLGDMPAASATSPLRARFCEMVKEFVGEMGGGLVVLSGPRFGPQQLAVTPLADLLPVVVDPEARLRDQQPFMLQLTPRAAEYKFMQIGSGASLKEMQKDWDRMGALPWFQPAVRRHPQAVVLAEHPTATCSDGKGQPLIAVRPYGRGEVVYLAFNETFRLRRGEGEKYFRQFWGQIMQRLALNHALGAEKRFIVRTDRRHYQLDDPVVLTVEVRKDDYEPLKEDDPLLPEHKLAGRWLLPGSGTQESAGRPLSLTQLRPGLFEARFAAAVPGEHRVRVTDPVTQKPVEWTFSVVSAPVERQRADRNVTLQQALSVETGGRPFALEDVGGLADAIRTEARTETNIEVVSLVSTWLCFALVVGLLLAEWLLRKWVSLP